MRVSNNQVQMPKTYDATLQKFYMDIIKLDSNILLDVRVLWNIRLNKISPPQMKFHSALEIYLHKVQDLQSFS